MRLDRRNLLAFPAAVLLVAAALAGTVVLARGASAPAAPEQEPARVEKIEGTSLSRIVLSRQAATRLDIQTAPIAPQPGRAGRSVIPYAAVLYDPHGSTFAYTSPRPLTYVRQPIRVRSIEGDDAILDAGPPAGTAVVTVGGAELLGAEYGVEE